jgi:hypothetical protein
LPSTYVQYRGDGSNRSFAVTFPYLARDHVKVTVDEEAIAQFVWITDSMIQLATAPDSDALVDLRRQTPRGTPVDFEDGSVLAETDLDLLATYTAYLSEEARDGSDDSLKKNLVGQFDGRGIRVVNLAPGVANSDAVNRAQLAQQHEETIATVTPLVNTAVSAAGIADAAADAAASDRAVVQQVATQFGDVAGAVTAASTQATISTAQAGLSAAAKAAAGGYALSAQAYADAAAAASKTYTTTSQGVAATTSGQTFFLRTPSPLTFNVYLNSGGVATFLYPVTFASADAVSAAVNVLQATTTASVTIGVLPVGWVEPTDYVGIDYRNDYGIKFYSDGVSIYPMLVDDNNLRAGWRNGGIRSRHPLDGLYYASISMARRYDPSLQGLGLQERFVDNINGNDAWDGLSWGTAFRTVERAFAVCNADGVNNIYVAYVRTSTFIGGNAAGWTAGTHNLLPGKQLKIVGTGAMKPWHLPGMRNSYTRTSFAWADMGNGIWKATGGVSVAARKTKVVFDLSVLDSYGMPTPSENLPGPYADEAAILAAMAGKPTFHTTSSDTLYVKLASGAEPDPGVNFAYVELAATNLFAVDNNATLMIEGFRTIHNGGTTNVAVWFAARPRTYTSNSTAPNVDHQNKVIFKNCEIYGSSGNGFSFLSISRAIVEGCRDGYCWLDGVNTHSLYTYGTGSSSPLEGLLQHTWIDSHISMFHGPNGFGGQPAVNASSNTYTDHDRGRGTIINSIGGFSNGGSVAIVGGAKYLCINVNIFEPKYVDPAVDTFQAAYLSSGNALAPSVNTDGSEIWAIHCTGNVRRNNGSMFYAGGRGRVVAAEFRGRKTKQLVGSGAALDGDGIAL